MASFQDIADLELADPHGLLAAHTSWERVRLSDIAVIVCGYPYQSCHFNASFGVPIIRIRDIRRGFTKTFYNGPMEGRIWVEPGDMVVGMDGVFHCALWRGEPALLNQRVCKITLNSRYYSKAFLSFVLPPYLRALHGRNTSLTVKHLSSRTLGGLRLPLPPRAEQDRIASRLDGLMGHISVGEGILRCAQDKIGEFRQAIIERAVSGASSVGFRRHSRQGSGSDIDLLRRSMVLRREVSEKSESEQRLGARRKRYRQIGQIDTKNLGRLPPGWVWATLGQLCWAANTGTGEKCSSIGEGQAVLRVVNIRAAEVTFDDLKYAVNPLLLTERDLVCSGDFLVIRSNGNAALAGTGALIRKTPADPTYFASYVLRFRIVPITPLAEWINIAWQSQSVREIVAMQISASNGHYNVSQSKLLRIPLPIPPVSEQDFLVGEVDAALREAATACASLAKGRGKISSLRHAVLGEAFRGRLVAQDPLDEPAREIFSQLIDTTRSLRKKRQTCERDFSSPLCEPGL